MAYLGMTGHYTLRSEYELNKGYADLYMEPVFIQHREMPYSYIIELKYIARTRARSGSASPLAAKVEAALQDAQIQLARYAQSPYILATKKHTQLRKLAIVWHGWEIAEMKEY